LESIVTAFQAASLLPAALRASGGLSRLGADAAGLLGAGRGTVFCCFGCLFDGPETQLKRELQVRKGFSMIPIQTILHPSDFSTRSQSAFDLACAVARDYDARVVVVHVQPPRMMGGEVHALITHAEEVDQDLRAELPKLQPPHPSTKIERILKMGDVATEIPRTAEETW
jgi:hypothetical protein